MNKTLIAALSVSAGLVAASGHAAGTADTKPNMPAVVTDATPAPGEPAAGRNSFTEGQAAERLRAKGYSGISQLTKDEHGVWRGTAIRERVKHRVAVDYQGNVTTE